MTNKLEKHFFDTFGIEPFIHCSNPIPDCDARKSGTCTEDCEYYSGVLYPQITDRILLELICIANKEEIVVEGETIESMKEQLLDQFLFFKKDVKKHIQKLFSSKVENRGE